MSTETMLAAVRAAADPVTAPSPPVAAPAPGIPQAVHDRAVADARADGEVTARAAATAEFGATLAALFPGDARAETLAEALKDGVPLATAQKFAARAQAAAKPSLHAEMAAVKPINLGAPVGEGDQPTLSAAEQGAAEATALLKAAGLSIKR